MLPPVTEDPMLDLLRGIAANPLSTRAELRAAGVNVDEGLLLVATRSGLLDVREDAEAAGLSRFEARTPPPEVFTISDTGLRAIGVDPDTYHSTGVG
jgi:hypothetical protein